MRWVKFILVQCALLSLVAGVLYLHKDRISIIKRVPDSLKQWYKPENDRQLWLHNMFKLRREMQAVRMYAEERNPELLTKWATRLQEHYLKIAEMVPEWEGKLDMSTIQLLSDHIGADNFQAVVADLDALSKSCESCHTDFRALTATLFRGPDFSELMIDSDTSYNAHMKQLISMVNTIKIASEDDHLPLALKTVTDLERGIDSLGDSCVNCHEKPQKVFPDDTIKDTIVRLRLSLQSGGVKDQGKELGTLAVQACATCHATHRLVFDMKSALQKPQDWGRFRH